MRPIGRAWARRISVLVLAGPTLCWAADTGELLQTSAAQLSAGQIDAAIAELERAADEGRRHPDLSFNRGLAYARRAKSPGERAGDLGQAAAAFAETLAVRPDDVDAQRGLEDSQLSVARRNSSGKSQQGAQVSAPLGLLERALLSMSPAVLFWLSAAGSLLLCIGIVVRLARSDLWRLVGTIAASLGALLLLPCAGLHLARQALFSQAKMAVVIASSAEVVDETGRRVPGSAQFAESTLLYVTGPERGLVRLVGVGSRQHLRVGQVRLVSRDAL